MREDILVTVHRNWLLKSTRLCLACMCQGPRISAMGCWPCLSRWSCVWCVWRCTLQMVHLKLQAVHLARSSELGPSKLFSEDHWHHVFACVRWGPCLDAISCVWCYIYWSHVLCVSHIGCLRVLRSAVDHVKMRDSVLMAASPDSAWRSMGTKSIKGFISNKTFDGSLCLRD